MKKHAFSKLVLGVALAVAATFGHAGAIHDAGLFTTVFPANDDGSTASVALGFTAGINGTSFANTFVNNNGNITFTAPLGTFTPSAISGGGFGPIIAPFFADVDTRATGSLPVTYGSAVLGGRNVFGVDYIHVGVFGAQPIFNDFQMILTDRSDTGAGNFDIQFNYDTMVWESGTASGASAGGLCLATDVGCVSALMGYWTSPTSTFTLPGSLVHGALINGGVDALISHSLNSAVAGQYNFFVRDGAVITPPPVDGVPEPETYAMLLAGLGLLGFIARRRKQNAV